MLLSPLLCFQFESTLEKHRVSSCVIYGDGGGVLVGLGCQVWTWICWNMGCMVMRRQALLTLVSDRPLQASEVKMHNCLLPSALASYDLFMGLTGGLMSYGDAFIMKDLIAAFHSLCFAFFVLERLYIPAISNSYFQQRFC